jgi:hypothetical protein
MGTTNEEFADGPPREPCNQGHRKTNVNGSNTNGKGGAPQTPKMAMSDLRLIGAQNVQEMESAPAPESRHSQNSQQFQPSELSEEYGECAEDQDDFETSVSWSNQPSDNHSHGTRQIIYQTHTHTIHNASAKANDTRERDEPSRSQGHASKTAAHKPCETQKKNVKDRGSQVQAWLASTELIINKGHRIRNGKVSSIELRQGCEGDFFVVIEYPSNESLTISTQNFEVILIVNFPSSSVSSTASVGLPPFQVSAWCGPLNLLLSQF